MYFRYFEKEKSGQFLIKGFDFNNVAKMSKIDYNIFKQIQN